MGRYGLVVAPFAILYFIYTQGWVSGLLWWILGPLAVYMINQRIAFSATEIESKGVKIAIAIIPTIAIISLYTLAFSGPLSWMVFLPLITIASFTGYKSLVSEAYIASRWRYANKNGGKDHRRKDNELIERVVEPGEFSNFSKSVLRPVVYQAIPLFIVLFALKSNGTGAITNDRQPSNEILKAIKTCNVRVSPSAKSNIVGTFKMGSETELLLTNGNWNQISVDGVKGYVHNSCGSIQ